MSRYLVITSALLLSAVGLPAGVAASAPAGHVEFPAYHTVRSGETLSGIAYEFLHDAYADFPDTSDNPPTDRQVANEVRQIRVLNRDELAAQDGFIRPGDRLLLAPSYWDVPDGRRGWSTGFSWCENAKPDGRNRAPFAGLELTVRLRDAPMDHRTERVVLVAHNTSDRDRTFWTDSLGEHAQLVDGDGHRTAVHQSDAISQRQWAVAAHSTQRLVVHVTVVRCGDTRFLDDRFANGRYRLVGTLDWSAGDRRGQWRAAREVRVRR
jgi:hypothetical protein